MSISIPFKNKFDFSQEQFYNIHIKIVTKIKLRKWEFGKFACVKNSVITEFLLTQLHVMSTLS